MAEESENTERQGLSRTSLLGYLTLSSSIVLALLVFAFLLAVKLRLLAKFGYYLGGVGLCFIVAGMVLLFNTGLLILGNLLILAGLHSPDDRR